MVSIPVHRLWVHPDKHLQPLHLLALERLAGSPQSRGRGVFAVPGWHPRAHGWNVLWPCQTTPCPRGTQTYRPVEHITDKGHCI